MLNLPLLYNAIRAIGLTQSTGFRWSCLSSYYDIVSAPLKAHLEGDEGSPISKVSLLPATIENPFYDREQRVRDKRALRECGMSALLK